MSWFDLRKHVIQSPERPQPMKHKSQLRKKLICLLLCDSCEQHLLHLVEYFHFIPLLLLPYFEYKTYEKPQGHKKAGMFLKFTSCLQFPSELPIWCNH